MPGEYTLSEQDVSSGLYRFTRNRFTNAGQDSYDLPPSQDQDAFEYMQNTMPIVTDHIERRWGLSPLTTPTISPLRMAEYRVSTNLIRGIVVTDGSTAALLNEADLTTLVQPIFTYTNSAQPPRFVTSRSYLYTGNGSDMYKSSGAVGSAVQQNWGIVAPGLETTPIGPNDPGSSSEQPWTGWQTPGGIFVGPNQGYATYNLLNSFSGTPLTPGNYGFVVPADVTVTGIQVDIYGFATGNTQPLGSVSLQKAAGGSSQPILTTLPAADGQITLGGPGILWGAGWNGADFADFVQGQESGTGFRVSFTPQADPTGPAPNINFSLDAMKVTLYYDASFTFTTPIAVGGNITLSGGRRYQAVFQNSANNGASDLSNPTISTGPITSMSVQLESLPVSADPQVTNLVLLATPDGGDLSTLYELAILPNGTTTYTDNTPEDVLLFNNVWQETDDQGVEHGVSGNTPPPVSNIFCKHKGRIYFLQGTTLWFSKSNDEMLTSTGLMCGRYEESVPGDYQMDVSDEAEIGSCLFSDGSILYISTEKQVRRLYGDGPLNYAKPETHFTEVGVMCQELLTTISVDGRPAGVVWLTPDLKIIGSDFLFYQNLGTPIQNILNTINPNAVKNVGWSTFIARGAYQFVVFGLPTGTSTQIDTILVFDMKRKKWHTWVLPQGIVVQSLLRNITLNGTPRLLVGGYYTGPGITQQGPGPQPQIRFHWWPGGGPNPVPMTGTQTFIWELTPNNVQDVVTTALTVPITGQLRTTWQYFEDQNLRKDFDEIEVFTKDPALTLTMEGATNSAEFTSPHSILVNSPLRVSAFGEYKWYLAGCPTTDRYYRFTFTSTFADRSFTDGYRMDVIPEHKF